MSEKEKLSAGWVCKWCGCNKPLDYYTQNGRISCCPDRELAPKELDKCKFCGAEAEEHHSNHVHYVCNSIRWEIGAWTQDINCMGRQLAASEARARELWEALTGSDVRAVIEVWNKHAEHFGKEGAGRKDGAK